MSVINRLSRLRSRWKSYKYRFAPWIVLNLQNEIKEIDQSGNKSKDFLKSNDEYVEDLIRLFQCYEKQDVKLVFRANEARENHFSVLHDQNLEILLAKCGFKVKVGQSSLKDAGRGVFVTEGAVQRGSIVALYPGTLYQPYNPIFIQSIANPFILRCMDGISVDGNTGGFSRLIYSSVHGRDRIGCYPSCDISWLRQTCTPVNPLNIGQIVNNAPSKDSSNVTYHEINFPLHCDPPSLLQFLPNNFYESAPTTVIRLVPLIAKRDIQQGEELFSSYFSFV